MKTRYLLSALALMAFSIARADTKPAMVVQVVETSDTDEYVAMMSKVNAIVKEHTGIETFRHVWEGDYAGENSHVTFVVAQFPSAADIYVLQAKLKEIPQLDTIQAQLKSMRHLGPSFVYKAIRYEGAYAGGAVFNTSIKCSDEAAYLKALDGLKAVLDASGFKDAKVNLWRLVAGRTEATHLVIIAFPTQLRVAELWDAISDRDILAEWNVGAAKIRTTLQNGSYHEITK